MDVKFDNNIPIYIQLLDYIKTYIISGQINACDRLPSVRELSILFKVNPNTMQKALNELESIGLIYTERTNGKYVTKDNKIIEKIKLEYANSIIDGYISNMKKIGISKEEAIKYLIESDEK